MLDVVPICSADQGSSKKAVVLAMHKITCVEGLSYGIRKFQCECLPQGLSRRRKAWSRLRPGDLLKISIRQKKVPVGRCSEEHQGAGGICSVLSWSDILSYVKNGERWDHR